MTHSALLPSQHLLLCFLSPAVFMSVKTFKTKNKCQELKQKPLSGGKVVFALRLPQVRLLGCLATDVTLVKLNGVQITAGGVVAREGR